MESSSLTGGLVVDPRRGDARRQLSVMPVRISYNQDGGAKA